MRSAAHGFPRFWLGPSQVELGTEILHGPRIWPEYHDSYYGVFVRDLDGNNIEAVCHR